MARPTISRPLLLCLGLLAACLALPHVAQATDNAYLISLCSRFLIFALAAVSLDLILGYGGMVSLGHAAYVGTGAYVAGILAWHMQDGSPLMLWPLVVQGTDNALVTIPAAVLCAAVMAGVFGALSLRTKGMHFIMITLAFAQMGFYFFVSLEAYGGDDGLSLWSRNTLPGLDLGDDTTFYHLCLGALALFVFLSYRLVNSRFGRVIRGCKENELRMEVLGYNAYLYKLVCFVIAGAGAGLAGALLTNQNEFVSPGVMHWTHSGELLVMVLLGGMGSLVGPVLGAVTLLSLEEILAAYTEHPMVYIGPFLVVAVLFAKRGLYGLLTGGNGGPDKGRPDHG